MQSDIENEFPPRRIASTNNNAYRGRGKAADESPPRTPTTITSRSAGVGGRSSQARPAQRETFLDDITPVDYNNQRRTENERIQDARFRDSHDLSLSPRQVTRDSLVDNMLLSLDQFSLGQVGAIHPTDDEMQLYASFADGDYSPSGHRPGHQYSYSSDYDNGDDASRYSSQYSRGRRSNSGSTFQAGLGRINSIRNDPLAGPAPYQNQPTQGIPHTRNQRGGRGSRGSSASSLDLAYAQGAASKRWANRRSSSFDQVQERTFRPSNISVHSFSQLDYDAAPTPTVPVGPRRVPPSPIQPPHPSLEVRQKLERKRSAKSTHVSSSMKGESAATIHFRGHSDHDRELPSLPAFIKQPAPLVGHGKSKDSAQGTAQGSVQQTKDRPGFFRRVFGGGSSRNNPIISSEPPSSHGSTASNETAERPRSRPQHIATQMKSRVPTPEASQPRPALMKKPSSFFRRRKKSVSECDIPPMPTPAVPLLDLQAHQAVIKQTFLPKAPESPVSSLRQVMNPYLTSPVKTRSSLLNTALDNESAKPAEVVRQSVTGFSSEFNPALKATIRAVPVSRESGSQLAPVRPNTRIPSDQTRNEYGATFLRDSSDNDLEMQTSSPPRPNTMKDDARRRLYINTNTPSPSDMLKDLEFGESEKAQPEISHPSSRADIPETSQSLRLRTHSDPIQSPEHEKYQEWVVLSKNKPAPEKAERLVLAPTLSEEDLVQNAPGLMVPSDITNIAPQESRSTLSDYKFASSLPIVQVDDGTENTTSPVIISSPSNILDDTIRAAEHSMLPTDEDRGRAKQLYEGNEDFIPQAKTATWLGEEGVVRHRTLVAYMELYEFANLNILASLRILCGRLVLKAESQQVDRILDVFAKRWCECNLNHGFKVTDVVHTICYSILLLNTDLHLADIDQKMTRSQFVKNTMSTVRSVVANNAPEAFESSRPSILPNKSQAFESDTATRNSIDQLTHSKSSIDLERERPSWRSSFKPPPKVNADGQQNHVPTPLDYDTPADDCGPLVKVPFYGTLRTWEVQLEIVLKDFYASIRSERLPLFGAPIEKPQALQASQSSLSAFTNGMLRRTPSVLSKATSELPRDSRARGADSARLGTGKWSTKNRSRPRLYANSAMSSSRTSLDDQSSMWSPSVASSTWTKYSLGKTQTSMSVDSYGSTWAQGDYQQSIGFANALSQAIIREETIGSVGSAGSEELRVAPLLEDESLELVGAPWAKEGIVKHKHHLESLEKKAKDRSWNETFAVIEKGYMSLFSFSTKSMRRQAKGKPLSGAGSVVGGGNWQENAESLGSFLLRQTIASALPSPGYSKARPHVWALSLPTGAVHLFQVGTPEIVREFVSTANYWSARLSNHPLVGGISNIEYGWSDAIVNNVLASLINETTRASVSGRRPSVQSSLRTSIDHQGTVGGIRARLPGDKIHIADWTPPTQSMRASNLMEQDQLNTLVTYVKGIEEELQKHNQLRSSMQQAFTPRHPNSHKAMANWEKKSSYLLREIVKFRTYIDSLQAADTQKQRIYAERAAEKALAETAEENEDE